jgi:hypothetical protein
MLISASRNPDGTYKTRVKANSGAELIADRTIANTPLLEVLVVTGGAAETAMLARDPAGIAWIKSTHATTTWRPSHARARGTSSTARSSIPRHPRRSATFRRC